MNGRKSSFQSALERANRWTLFRIEPKGKRVSDAERRQRGMTYFNEVYGGIVPFPPEHLHDDFLFNTVDQLFSEVWSRPGMSIRDRRLVAIGIIASQAEEMTFEIQIRAALHKGELSRDDVKEIVVLLPYYIGYPKASRMRAVTQRIFAEMDKAAVTAAE